MEKNKKGDPVIVEAKRRMVAAGKQYSQAVAGVRAELRAVMAILRSHPDYERVEYARARGREAGPSLVTTLHSICSSAQTDEDGATVTDFGEGLIRDATGGAEQLLREERREERAAQRLRREGRAQQAQR